MKRNEETQEILFDLNEESDCADVFQSLLAETAIGRRYVADFYDGNGDGSEDSADRRKVLRAVDTLFNHEDNHYTLAQLAKAFETVIKSGQIRPRAEEEDEVLEEPVVDTTPRGKDGKPLTGSQIAWREFGEWSAAHTSSECKARANSDEAYGKFYRTNLTREFAEQPVGDAVQPAGQVARSTQATQQLVQFVKDYHREPSVNLKPKGGFVSLAGEQLSWTLFQETLNKAAAAGLL